MKENNLKEYRINSETSMELIRGYLNGLNISELAKKYGIYKGYISVILRAYDVKLRNDVLADRKRLNSKEVEARNANFKNDYENGMGADELAAKYGISKSYIYTLAHIIGANRNKVLEARNLSIKSDYEQGMPEDDIAQKYNLSQSRVRVLLNRMGIIRKKISNIDKDSIELIKNNKDIDVYRFMTPREEKIVKNRLEERMTYEEIAKEFGLTKERIRQIQKTALKRAKKAIAIHKARITREENKKKWLLKLEKMKSEQKDKLPNKNEKASLISMPIEELGLDTRSYNCLIKHGINTIEDLITNTEDEIGSIRGLGILSLCRIKDKLSGLGLSLFDSEIREERVEDV